MGVSQIILSPSQQVYVYTISSISCNVVWTISQQKRRTNKKSNYIGQLNGLGRDFCFIQTISLQCNKYAPSRLSLYFRRYVKNLRNRCRLQMRETFSYSRQNYVFFTDLQTVASMTLKGPLRPEIVLCLNILYKVLQTQLLISFQNPLHTSIARVLMLLQ